MNEVCIENAENITVNVDKSEYQHLIDIERCLTPSPDEPSTLFILNQEIDISEVFLKLWGHYKLKVCADGGANRLYEFFGEDEAIRSQYLPDYIVGDLDSLDEKVEKYYREKNVVVIRQLTQNSTDFSKCLDVILLHWNSEEFVQKVRKSTELNHSVELYDGLHKWRQNLEINTGSRINMLALGGIDGRFDQTIHSISQLYRLSGDKSQFNLCFLSSTDLIFLVPSSSTLLTYSKKFRNECMANCGLFPLGGPTVLQETQGLKWDVRNWATSIAEGKVTSNNRLAGEDKCLIKTKDNVVMSIEMRIAKLTNFL